jgi:uncharacterized protein (TIGR03083 family)
MAAELDYLSHLTTESTRFAAALQSSQPGAQVPTCPDWDAEDLLWHLTEVQWFWGRIVRDRLTRRADVRALDIGVRPGDRRAVLAFYDRVSHDLVDLLSAETPDTPVWTWADDQSVGFVRRRQAHEALIHRVDAELTSGERTPLDADLCTDGVDEVLRVMYGGAPPWGVFTAEPAATIRFRTTDTDRTWLVTLGRFVGTDPDSKDEVDELDLRVAGEDDGAEAAAVIAGSAADLDCWLWSRPTFGSLERSGDAAVLTRFDATIAPGIN